MNDVIEPEIQIQSIAVINTQYEIELPPGCKHFSLQCRTAVDVRFSWTSGNVAGPTEPYGTMKAGASLSSPEKIALKAGFDTLYVAAGSVCVVEVLCWKN